MLKIKLRKIVKYANRREEILRRAATEFFEGTELYPGMENFDKISALFSEWLIFEFKLDSKINIISDYYFKNPDNLSKDLLEELKQIIDTQRFEMLELITLKRGEWLEAYGLYSGKTYKIYDRLGSLTAPNVRIGPQGRAARAKPLISPLISL